MAVQCLRFAPNSEHLVSCGDMPRTGAVSESVATAAQRNPCIMLWHWPSSADPIFQATTTAPVLVCSCVTDPSVEMNSSLLCCLESR